MDAIADPWLRAEVLRVLHKYTAGVPELTVDEAVAIASRRLNSRDMRFMQAVESDDLALLNACLEVEQAMRVSEMATLERLLSHTQWSDGLLDDRLFALPEDEFAQATLDVYALGWIDREEA